MIPETTQIVDLGVLVYLVCNIVVLIINIMGFKHAPFLLIIGGIFAGIILVPTLIAFGEFYILGIMFLMINVSLPVAGLTKALK